MTKRTLDHNDKSKPLTLKFAKSLDFNKVIYAERSHSGAMGIPGNTMLYVLDDEKLAFYQLILSDSNSEEWFEIQGIIDDNRDKFDFVPGGMGNAVFIKKHSDIETVRINDIQTSGDSHLILSYGDIACIVHSSVYGVFDSIDRQLDEIKGIAPPKRKVLNYYNQGKKTHVDAACLSDYDRIRGIFAGLVVGDALGAPFEFGYTADMIRTKWSGEMQNHRLPKGYYTDDTAMALCLADSLLECGGYDSYDVMKKYQKWANEGYRDAEEKPASDIGRQTQEAIAQFAKHPVVRKDSPRTHSAGNGCIMRLAPVIIACHDESSWDCSKLAKISARETHYSDEAEAGAELFAALLYNALRLRDKRHIVMATDFASSDTYVRVWSRVMDVLEDDFDPETLKGLGGYVVDSLRIAVWGFLSFSSFKQGMIEIIRLGGDTDTNAAIYGQLAGAYYGYSRIPKEWLYDTYKLEDVMGLAKDLCATQPFKIFATRFEEDGENIFRNPELAS